MDFNIVDRTLVNYLKEDCLTGGNYFKLCGEYSRDFMRMKWDCNIDLGGEFDSSVYDEGYTDDEIETISSSFPYGIDASYLNVHFKRLLYFLIMSGVYEGGIGNGTTWKFRYKGDVGWKMLKEEIKGKILSCVLGGLCNNNEARLPLIAEEILKRGDASEYFDFERMGHDCSGLGLSCFCRKIE